jgi:hypothetical protein
MKLVLNFPILYGHVKKKQKDTLEKNVIKILNVKLNYAQTVNVRF